MSKLLRVVGLLLLAGAVYAADFYKVNVTRLSKDLYKENISGGYIRTVACDEFVYYDDGTLVWNPPNNKLVFSTGHACDVRGVFK
jgi:hypothetical protein